MLIIAIAPLAERYAKQSEHTVRNWFGKFHAGDTGLQSESKPGRSTDIDDKPLMALVEQNQRQTVTGLAGQMGASRSIHFSPPTEVERNEKTTNAWTS